MAKIDVSIIMLTRNAGNQFNNTLEAIFKQVTKYKKEVIVIDTASTDDTLNIAKEFDVKIVNITKEEFGHGKTRNYGAKIANGEFLVFITQDALPKGKDWLDNLLKPFSQKQVVGVYARQIPRDDASPFEKYFLTKRYPDIFHSKNLKKILGPIKLENIFFSNVCSAIRRKALLKIPFDEDLIMSEDQQWAKEVILAGYSIAYQPKAIVIHSHTYKLPMVFRRFFDSGVSFKQMKDKGEFSLKLTEQGLLKDGLHHLKMEIKYLKKHGYGFLIPYDLVYNLMKYVGIEAGKRNHLFPKKLRKKMSLHSGFWENK